MSEAVDNSLKAVKIQEFNDRLADLRLRRNEARNKNFEQVNEENRRKNLVKNQEIKKARAEVKLKELEARKEAEEKGESYDASVRLQQSIVDIEEYHRKKKRPDPEPGFSDYSACHLRRYHKNIRLLKPNLEKYEKIKASGRHVVDTSGPGVLDLFAYSEPSAQGVERVVDHVKQQRDRREKLSRRRPYLPEADIDFINERNRRYNLRTQRFFGKYTENIKNDLERGTAM